MLGLSAVSSASKMEGKIASNSNSTNSTVHSNINRVISGVKYITDAPIIYTKQALKSTVVSSATALVKNTSKDYVPGMPPSVYEKYKKSLEPKFNGKTPAINKMLDNLDKDTSLKLSEDKKAAMLVAGEKLLNEGYEPEFVAGVLGNIMNEGTAGKFESSSYDNPDDKPAYLKYMEKDFDYANKFSGNTIEVVGIKEAIKLQKQASKIQHTITVNGEKKKVQDKFGFGMCQFTGSRTSDVLDVYQKFYDETKNNHPTQKQCAEIEAEFMVKELEGDYKHIYEDWKEGDRTAERAGELICNDYEKPHDPKTQASERASNATK